MYESKEDEKKSLPHQYCRLTIQDSLLRYWEIKLDEKVAQRKLESRVDSGSVIE